MSVGIQALTVAVASRRCLSLALGSAQSASGSVRSLAFLPLPHQLCISVSALVRHTHHHTAAREPPRWVILQASAFQATVRYVAPNRLSPSPPQITTLCSELAVKIRLEILASTGCSLCEWMASRCERAIILSWLCRGSPRAWSGFS